MFTKSFALAAFAAAAAASVLMAPLANADDEPCDVSASVTVCESNGSAALVATPPEVSGGFQNGPYGPAGDTAPVGGNGL